VTCSETTGRGIRRGVLSGVICALAAALAVAAPALAATPGSGSVSPDAQGHGKTTWSGTIVGGSAESGTTDDCFDADGKPDPTSGCDFSSLDVSALTGF
jgi:hypothetical protein